MSGETEEFARCIKEEWTREAAARLVPGTQLALYCMVGGGMLGRSYAEQPGEAYIDARVGRLPYTRREIERVRRVLVALAERAGKDPNNLGRMPDFHGSGVF